jgi:hypothetical protein
LFVEVGFDRVEISHASRDDSCSVSCATELEIFTYRPFQLLLQLDQVDDRCYGYWRRSTCFAGAVASCGENSVLVESVSMLHTQSRVKKFRVVTSLRGVSTMADNCGRHCFL